MNSERERRAERYVATAGDNEEDDEDVSETGERKIERKTSIFRLNLVIFDKALWLCFKRKSSTSHFYDFIQWLSLILSV